MLSLWKYHKIFVLTTFTAILLYGSFAYSLERTDFTKLSTLWLALFFLSYKIIEWYRGKIQYLAAVALLFRLVFLFAIPNLSQDFYRFIWDGRLLLEGLNPYLSLPETWIETGNVPIAQAQQLYEGMGALNGSHYTNYPPISQLCYVIAAIFAGNSILGSTIILRMLIILADIGIFFFGIKLLRKVNLPEHRIFWYLLNPFVIIELTGNLHFEAVMIFFIIWALYLLHKGFWYWAAILLGLSVSVKLIPLLFLPLFFQKLLRSNSQSETNLPFYKSIWVPVGFYSLVLGTTLLTFVPFLSGTFISNFTQTIGLWFQNFEFNASIYYIIRWVGFQTVGWNIIGTAGRILPIVVVLILILLTFFRKNHTTVQLITGMLLGICSYYFLSTTVHPWYITVPLALCVFTNYKFPIWWSFIIILSYTAYIHPEFKENLWMVGLEYVVVFAVFTFEIIKNTSFIKEASRE